MLEITPDTFADEASSAHAYEKPSAKNISEARCARNGAVEMLLQCVAQPPHRMRNTHLGTKQALCWAKASAKIPAVSTSSAWIADM
jgi:hypothetical protein